MPAPETPNPSIAEIHYFVPDYLNKDREDFEKIIAAMGAYEAELEKRELRAQPSVEFHPDGETAVLIALSRHIFGRRMRAEALHDTEEMRGSVEAYFEPADRERLSKHFLGVKVPEHLETE